MVEPSMSASERDYPIQFTGSGGEYFRIWIVNLALSILSLGIYSAWAKVRRKRYFNNHTLLDGHHFDYLADPIAILKGRVIAAVCLSLYLLTNQAFPLVAAVLMLLFFVVSPWIIVRALQFNARNSSHRGLRFDFKGDLRESNRIFLGIALLSFLTMGLLLPYLLYRKTAFIAGNHAYGNLAARFHGNLSPFYRIALIAVLIVAGSLGVALLGAYTLLGDTSTHASGTFVLVYLGFGLLGLYAVLPVIAGYFNARVAQQTFGGTRFGQIGFTSRHRARGLIWLYVSNLVLIVLTLGLFIPWAQVRTARYWLDNLALLGPEGGLDDVVADAGRNLSATGSEMAEVFDLDIGLA